MVIAELVAQFTHWAAITIGAYGYFGVFLVSLIGNAAILFPAPSFAVIFAFGAVLNPWLVALAGASGAAIGELTGYALGKGSQKMAEKKYGKTMEKWTKWILGKKNRMFLAVLIFSATPLPDDVVGIFSGIVNYDLKKFLLAEFIGKLIMALYLAFAGYYILGSAPLLGL